MSAATSPLSVKEEPSEKKPWVMPLPEDPVVSVVQPFSEELFKTGRIVQMSLMLSVVHGISVFERDVVVRCDIRDDFKTAKFEFFNCYKMDVAAAILGHSATYARQIRDADFVRCCVVMYKKTSERSNRWQCGFITLGTAVRDQVNNDAVLYKAAINHS